VENSIFVVSILVAADVATGDNPDASIFFEEKALET